MAQLLDLMFRKNRLAQDLGKQAKQKRQVLCQSTPVKANSMQTGIETEAGANRFQFIIDLIEGMMGSTAHQRRGSEISQAQFFIRIKQTPRPNVPADRNGGAVEIRTRQYHDIVDRKSTRL